MNAMKEIRQKIKDKGLKLEHEVREKTVGYIVASFGLVAGLAWNEAIKAFIEAFFPLQKDTLKAKFIYAVAITFVLVLVSLYLSRFLSKGKTAEGSDSKNASVKK
jgi:hypothetical protein